MEYMSQFIQRLAEVFNFMWKLGSKVDILWGSFYQFFLDWQAKILSSHQEEFGIAKTVVMRAILAGSLPSLIKILMSWCHG